MNNQYPDRISVEEKLETDISPEWAVLIIKLEGTSSFTGGQAYKNSREVADFISKLGAVNYPPDNIILENVMFQNSSGALTKSSAASFSLKLNKIELSLVPQILTVIATQKNIKIEALQYDFGDLGKQKKQLYIQACKAAKEQAQEISEVLGIPLLGVYNMTSSWHLPYIEPVSQNYGTVGLMKSRSSVNKEIEGLNFIADQKEKLGLVLKIDFRVGAFK